jgi:hypothetical protein
VVSDWSPCVALCGLSSTGYRFRTVQCVSVPSVNQPSSTVVAATMCSAATKPLSLEPCQGIPCPVQFWQASGAWTPCSAQCVSNASDKSALGVSTREPPMCMVTLEGSEDRAAPGNDTVCEAAGLVSVWGGYADVAIVPTQRTYHPHPLYPVFCYGTLLWRYSGGPAKCRGHMDTRVN